MLGDKHKCEMISGPWSASVVSAEADWLALMSHNSLRFDQDQRTRILSPSSTE